MEGGMTMNTLTVTEIFICVEAVGKHDHHRNLRSKTEPKTENDDQNVSDTNNKNDQPNLQRQTQNGTVMIVAPTRLDGHMLSISSL